jgi:hypothetical protein
VIRIGIKDRYAHMNNYSGVEASVYGGIIAILLGVIGLWASHGLVWRGPLFLIACGTIGVLYEFFHKNHPIVVLGFCAIFLGLVFIYIFVFI